MARDAILRHLSSFLFCMKYHLLAAITGLLMAFGPASTAQRLTGKVLDASTGQPVPYASISVLNSPLGTTSNAEGEFELGGVALPGKLVVSVPAHPRCSRDLRPIQKRRSRFGAHQANHLRPGFLAE